MVLQLLLPVVPTGSKFTLHTTISHIGKFRQIQAQPTVQTISSASPTDGVTGFLLNKNAGLSPLGPNLKK